MGWKDWVAAGVITYSVVVPTAHGHDLHLHPEPCKQVITTDNITAVQTTGGNTARLAQTLEPLVLTAQVTVGPVQLA